MTTSSFDAAAITQPGGLYASINNGLLQSLQAYLMHRDRQAQAERDMRREERGMNRQQLMDALTMAERYGVAPEQGQAGWLNPGDMPVIEAARQRFQQRQKGEAAKAGILAQEAELARLRAVTQAASAWSEHQRRTAQGVVGGTILPDAAAQAGLDPDHAAALYDYGAQRRRAAEQDRLTRESEGRARAERDQAREDRERAWHERRMAAPGPLSAQPRRGKRPERAQRESPIVVDPPTGQVRLRPQRDQRAAELWGQLHGLLEDELRAGDGEGQVEDNSEGERDLLPPEAEPAPEVEPQAAPVAPARRSPWLLAGRRALEDAFLRDHAADVAAQVRMDAARKARMPV